MLISFLVRVVFALTVASTFLLTAWSTGMVAAQPLTRVRKPRYEILYQIQFLEASARETEKEEERVRPTVPRLSWLAEKVRWLLCKKRPRPHAKEKVLLGCFFGFQLRFCF